MKNLKITVGTETFEAQVPESWEELTQEQFLMAATFIVENDYVVPVPLMQKILGLPDEAALFILPAGWLGIFNSGFQFLDDPTAIKSWLVSDITLADGRHVTPPAANFDNVSWEEFVFADQLAQAGNWAAVAACLFRPDRPQFDEEADERIPFSRFGVSRRLPLFQQLPSEYLTAIEVNYSALRIHLTDRYPYLFSSDNSADKSKSPTDWVPITRSLLGDTIWEEEQLLHTSVAQVLYHLNKAIADSQKNKK